MIRDIVRYFVFHYWADQYHAARMRIDEIDTEIELARRERKQCEMRMAKADAKCCEYGEAAS